MLWSGLVWACLGLSGLVGLVIWGWYAERISSRLLSVFTFRYSDVPGIGVPLFDEEVRRS
jgi:hypothetical protein